MGRWVAFAQGFLFAVLLVGRREYPDALHGALILAGVTLNVWVLVRNDGPPLCADGTLIHDFKGQPVCPACGFTGLRLNDGGEA